MKTTNLLHAAATAIRLKEEIGQASFKLLACLRDVDDFSEDFADLSQEIHSYHALAETLQKAKFNHLSVIARLAEIEGEF